MVLLESSMKGLLLFVICGLLVSGFIGLLAYLGAKYSNRCPECSAEDWMEDESTNKRVCKNCGHEEQLEDTINPYDDGL